MRIITTYWPGNISNVRAFTQNIANLGGYFFFARRATPWKEKLGVENIDEIFFRRKNIEVPRAAGECVGY